MEGDPLSPIDHALRTAAASLRDAGIPFMLGGGLACWARGAPRTEHDVDLMIAPEDCVPARDALVEAGMRFEEQPEDWLLKVYDGDVPVDLIFAPLGVRITRESIAAAEQLQVLAIAMRVMALEDVLVSRLLALDERRLDFSALLQIARAVREQVDWADVHRRAAGWPPGHAFFVLLADLDVAGPFDRVARVGTPSAMGIIDKITGKTKQAAGDVLDVPGLRREGLKEERKGVAKDELKHANEAAERRAEEVADLERQTR
jgi:uncharacterized protein YjbJ (UPF0337 family)/predicted nucleotidyltransferase